MVPARLGSPTVGGRGSPATVPARARRDAAKEELNVQTIHTYGAGLLILRVVIGLTMAAHGYAKFFKGGRIPGTARWFDSIGMRPGKVAAPAAASTEIGSGILFALGF